MNKVGIIVLLLVAHVCPARNKGEVSEVFISFDTLVVADSWFKKALDACMIAWGAMRLLAHDDATCKNTMLDTVAGNLVYADFCVKRVCVDSNEQASADMAYLNQVIAKMCSEMTYLRETSELFDEGRVACVMSLLNRLSLAQNQHL